MTEPRPSFTGPHTRTWVLQTAADTHGQLFEQRVEYAPGSPFPLLHFHPAQAETFEVEQGAMVYVVEGEERRVATGESLVLPPGTTHKARNASTTEPAIIRWETRPARRSQAFFGTAAALGDAGALEQALLAHEFRDVFRASGPPGLMVPLLAALARLLGRSLPHLEP